jgi:hypothetical protein
MSMTFARKNGMPLLWSFSSVSIPTNIPLCTSCCGSKFGK